MPGASSKRPSRTSADPLGAILAEDSLEGALATGLGAIARAAGAEIAAILVFDETRLVHELWHPAEGLPAQETMGAIREAARAALGVSNATAPARPGEAAAPPSRARATLRARAGLRLLPLVAHGKPVGAVCLKPGSRKGRQPAEVSRLARALAFRTAAELEIARGRALQGRYERWFKTLDEQVRVLDR